MAGSEGRESAYGGFDAVFVYLPEYRSEFRVRSLWGEAFAGFLGAGARCESCG
ncbi:hypothetical protein [Amycolatopsis japonica]|uniref:hypothetical protein n=1 Tax=Amycolatopsis japonica TaxID=208439 RepID=UPI001E336976|nr:hypothetical protein [Amycolatopsis japonica]